MNLNISHSAEACSASLIRLFSCFHFLLCVGSFFLVACDSKDLSWQERHLEQANALFVRIQASYEVIETKEIVEFDHIMSCYNAEVKGSFRGVEYPKLVYKVTSNRAVLSVTHPNHYCRNGGFGTSPKFDKYFGLATFYRDLYRAPILGWYDDVDDLRVGYYYLTNDAYESPRAKVRFIDYKASRSTHEEYKAYIQKTEEEFTPTGALTSPFGGKGIASSYDRTSVRLLRVPEAKSVVQPFLKEHRTDRIGETYFCSSDLDPESKKWRWRRWPILAGKEFQVYLNSKFPESSQPPETDAKALRKWREERSEWGQEWKHYQLMKLNDKKKAMRRGKIRIDREALRGEAEPESPIEEVYPMVLFDHPRPGPEGPGRGAGFAGIVQILYDPTWRGFGIVNRKGFGPFMAPDYEGDLQSVLYINDDYVCGKDRITKQWTVLDSGRGLIFNSWGSKG